MFNSRGLVPQKYTKTVRVVKLRGEVFTLCMESIKKQSIIEKGRFVSDVAKFKST